MASSTDSHASTDRAPFLIAPAGYAGILVAFWLLARSLSLSEQVGHMPTTFLAFALLFGPFWFFGFGGDLVLRRALSHGASRVVAPGLLAIPYLICRKPNSAGPTSLLSCRSPSE
jgi:hypothetical protein